MFRGHQLLARCADARVHRVRSERARLLIVVFFHGFWSAATALNTISSVRSFFTVFEL